MARTFVAKTKNGFDVYIDVEHSHAATHLQDQPALFGLLQEVLRDHEVRDGIARFEVDMGRVVGEMGLAETNADDDVFYAKRPNRAKYSRFVRNKPLQPTSYVTVDLRKQRDGTYDIYTAYIGRLTPSFPYGKDDPDEHARSYWASHALVVGTQEVVSGTETTECPW